jgi:zinc/manganese transport system ATP-binding protein
MQTHDHSKNIIISNLCLHYGQTIALNKINGEIVPGSLTAVVGPNGGGKSTFVKTLAGILKPTSGFINHQCKDTCDSAYLPQYTAVDHDFPVTVQEVISMGLWHKTGAFKAFSSKDKNLIREAIHQVGLEGMENRLIRTLSGGQFQRMLFARIILEDSSLIILDEPFTAIDVHTSEALIKLIKTWHKQGKTILLVLHDLQMAKKYFDQTIILARECIVWGKTKEVLTEENIALSYRNLLRGIT